MDRQQDIWSGRINKEALARVCDAFGEIFNHGHGRLEVVLSRSSGVVHVKLNKEFDYIIK